VASEENDLKLPNIFDNLSVHPSILPSTQFESRTEFGFVQTVALSLNSSQVLCWAAGGGGGSKSDWAKAI
jgi:hypothetical protein